MTGLKPHTHAERAAIIEQLIPLWQQKFGDNLIAIAASASFARGEDTAYSDLELDLFLKEQPVGEDGYLQRVVDGMLVEVIYHTPESFYRDRAGIAPHWHLSASDRLLPVYNAPAVEKILAQVRAVQPSGDEFLQAAFHERGPLQESFAKVLNAVEQNNVEGVSLLVMDAVLTLLKVLALVNQRPFVTFARSIEQARTFPVKPPRFDALLDILVQGTYRDLPHLREVMLAVFAGIEAIFEQHGIHLYDDPLDPNLPNPAPPTSLAQGEGGRPAADPGGAVRLIPVNADNFYQCISLPTGEDHRHVATNAESIAEAQFHPQTKSCCVFHGTELVGYVMVTLEFDHDLRLRYWVDRLMMAEGQRGKGYGRAVLQQVIAEARQVGCAAVALSTHPDNFKAIRLYENLGFHATEMDDSEMVYVLPLTELRIGYHSPAD